MMLLCITSSIIAICGFITGIQSQSGESVAGFGLFTILLVMGSIYNGSEAWRYMEMHDEQIKIDNSNNGGEFE
jgi:hypothetical protein